MILYITKDMQAEYQRELQQYFRLRKAVFCDHHGWAEPNEDGTETDALDEIDNLYILYIDPQSNEVVGGARMVPSTGLTLMHTCWPDMLPEPDDFRSPNLWEVTRLCVNPDCNSGRSKDFVNRAFLALMLSVLDFANENGITGVMAICETRLVRMCAAFGGGPEVISEKTESDGCEISFVVWPADSGLRESFGWARQYMGGAKPVLFKAA